jgi:cation diffusion facilitator family transporter
MHRYHLEQWQHDHDFEIHDRTSERRVLLVVGITLVTMVAEIVAGMLFGSMALLADGWHMGTHAAALGIAALAYYLARKYARDRCFTFGTGKIGVLGGYTSAVVLAVVALLMLIECIQRLLTPQAIRFNEAIAVAVLGLGVNLASALLLQGQHTHESHSHNGHEHEDHHHQDQGKHQDHNMRAAYLHVLADALTSILAIAALTAGKFWRWIWMDPVMGIVGAIIITLWARSLLRDTGKILLDRDVRKKTMDEIIHIIESDADNRITDLHLWRIGSNKLAAIISLVTHYPNAPDHYKKLLSKVPDLAHITVEVIHCRTEPCLPQPK